MVFFVDSSTLDVLLAELSLLSFLPPPTLPSIPSKLTPRFLRKRSRGNDLSWQFSSHCYSHIIGKSWCLHSLELRLEILQGEWFTSLRKTNKKMATSGSSENLVTHVCSFGCWGCCLSWEGFIPFQLQCVHGTVQVYIHRRAEHFLGQESWKRAGLSPAIASPHSCSPAHLSWVLGNCFFPCPSRRRRKWMPSAESWGWRGVVDK